MAEFLEILKYVLPSLVVMVTAFIVMRMFMEAEQRKMDARIKPEQDKILIPLRLQAYERMILFLERISPSSLILRTAKPEMDAGLFQTALVRSIREEFEHNLSQQLYLSDEAWEKIKQAKEEMIRLINTSVAQVDSHAPSHELASVLFDSIQKTKQLPVENALAFLKKEFRETSMT